MYTENSIMQQAIGGVSSQIASLNAMAATYGGQLSGAISGISAAANMNTPSGPTITAPTLSVPTFSSLSAPTPLPSVALGEPNITIPSAPSAANGSLPSIPSMPAVPSLSMPAPPVMTQVSPPQSPKVDLAVAIPSAPVIAMPEMDALDKITLPIFAFRDLPTFDGTPPDPDAVKTPSVFINWREPEYASEALDDITAKVRTMLQGGTGIPPVVEEALFARTRERERAETEREIQAANDTWAARGFSMPPGMLAKQAAVIREQGRLKSAELNRDIMVQAATWEIENLRFAVQQGIALEQLTQNLFINMVQRLFEAARFQVESEISVFNAQVGLFNAKKMKELREQITTELLPRAFTRVRKTYAWINVAAGWLVIDAASQSRAEDVLELLRISLDTFPVSLLRTERSPMSAMADWLAGEAPEGFTLDQDFALQSICEDRARATFKGHDLEAAHVTEHLEAGRLPIKLAMTFDDRLSFVLTERGEIKRLDFLDVIRDQVKADEHEDAQSIFDAEFALMTGELLRLLPAVVGAMGGEIQRAPDLVDQAKEAA